MTSESKWLGNVSDLMSGLMLMFMFIAIVYMQRVDKEKEKINTEKEEIEKLATKLEAQGSTIREITATYNDLQKGIYIDLLKEFKDDLISWDATLEEDSTIKFNEPEILFESGKADLKPRFIDILTDFFPRYLKILQSEKYINEIVEVKIEGHTNSQWLNSIDLETRYLKNAELSQERSFQVLSHCFLLEDIKEGRPWLIKHLRANGLSFARPVFFNSKEDYERSRRVEFKVITKSEEKIIKILEVQSNADAS